MINHTFRSSGLPSRLLVFSSIASSLSSVVWSGESEVAADISGRDLTCTCPVFPAELKIKFSAKNFIVKQTCLWYVHMYTCISGHTTKL